MSPQTDELFRYVPSIALDWERRAQESRCLSQEATLLFVDISGFTALSERLAGRGRIGAEELTVILGGVFGRMLDVVHARGGSMLKFGGDALLLLFERDDHPIQAAAAALEMRKALREASQERTSVGRIHLAMSSGLHTGPVDLFLVGTSHRELMITGPAASRTTDMEATANAGEILASAETSQRLPASMVGAPKESGYLLRGIRRLPPAPRPRRWKQLAGDPEEMVPVALRSHLSSGVADSEHRIATVGFVKFKGVDALLASEGTERVAEELHSLVTAVQEAVDGEGVTFLASDIDSDGGKIILATGVPTAAHDDEGRMLRALSAIVETSTVLSVQAGANRGHVFAGNVGTPVRATYTVMGDTVNLAARFMAAAGPGRLLAGPSVLDLSSTLFRTEALEPFRVKGKAEPVRAFSVHEALGVKPPEAKSELPFRGREAELQGLVAIVTTCAQVGQGGMVTVSGDTGIGKSRLIEEVLARCPDMDVGRVQADPYGIDNPYWALRDPIRRLLGVVGSTREDLGASLLERVEALAPSLLWAAPLLADVMHITVSETAETAAIDPKFRPARTAAALIDLFDVLYTRPLALLVEDGQWLDGSSFELLRRVGEAAENRPWTVVLTTRHDEVEGFGERIVLHPLDDSAVRAIAAEATSSSPLRPTELDAIVNRVGGNPLFLHEILTMIKETGSADEIPESLDAVVSKQIDTLPPLARQALRHASVLGRSFRTDAMMRFLGDSGLAVDRATKRELDGFLEPDGRVRTRFRHAVVHDVAYGGLAYRRRRELHALAGAVIEDMAKDDLADAAETLALHFYEAGEHAKAWRHSLVAGGKAKRTYANAEAANQYRRAVDAVRHLDGVAAEAIAGAWISLGEVRDLMGRYEEAREAFGRAARLVSSGPQVAELNLRKAEAWFGSGNLRQAKRSLTTARKAITDDDSNEARRVMARIDAYESSVQAADGNPLAALDSARRAIEGARATGEEDALARAYGSMDWANFMLGNDEPRMGEAAVAIYDRLGQVDRSAMTMNMLGAFAYLEGNWDGAIDWYQRSVDAAELSGNAFHAANTKANIAEVLIGQRRHARAMPLLEDADRFFRAAKSELIQPFVDLQLARARAALGDLDAAIPELERLFADQIAAGEGFSWPETAIALADALLENGDSETAMDRIERFVSEMPESAAHLRAALDRIRALAAMQAGEHEEALRLGESALVTAREQGDPYSELQVLEALLEIESGAGMTPDPAHMTRASELATRLGVERGSAPT